MERVYVFLIRNDVWIYILCALGLLWYTNEFARARWALRRAMFGLERESSLRARNSALLFIFIFASIIGAVLYVNYQVAPTLPQELLRPPTPTPNPLSFPASPTPAGTAILASPTPPIAPTVTLAGNIPLASPIIPTIVITDTTPAGAATIPAIQLPTATVVIGGCSPTVTITDPRDGDTVVGTVSFFGSANIPNFAYYDLEINGPQTNDRWASLLGRKIAQRVEDGLLASADLSTWTSGPYLVRLSVTNTADVITNQCEIRISLDNG